MTVGGGRVWHKIIDDKDRGLGRKVKSFKVILKTPIMEIQWKKSNQQILRH